MSNLDDFDDDETVVHVSARSSGADDFFDDDETFLASEPAPTMQAVQTHELIDLPDLERGAAVTRHVQRVTLVQSPGPTNMAAAEPARSIQELQDRAPLGAGWRPPDRPTSYTAADSQLTKKIGSSHVVSAAVVLALAFLGAALSVGAWLLVTGP